MASAQAVLGQNTGTKVWQSPRRWLSELRDGLGAYGLLPLAVLFGLNLVDEFDRVAFGALAPEIRDAFGLSDASFLAIATATGVLPILLSVPIGVMADRSNRVRMSQWAALVWALTALAIGFIPSLGVLIAARLVGGVGKLNNEPVHPSLLADYYPPAELGRVVGIHRFANTLGLAVGPAAGYMGQRWGYRPTFVILTIPTLILFVLSFRLKEPARTTGDSMLSVDESQKIPWREGFRLLRSVKSLRLTWTGAFFFGSGIAPVAALFSLFFEEVYNLSASARGGITAISGVFAAIGLSWGTRLTQRAIFTGRADKLPVAVALLIMSFAVGFILMAIAPWVGLSIAFGAFASLGITGFFPPYTVLVTFATPNRLRAQAFSYSLLFFALGALIFVPTVGSIGDRYGYRLSTGILSILVAIGGSFGFLVRRHIVADIERSSRLLDDHDARKSKRQRRQEAAVLATATAAPSAAAPEPVVVPPDTPEPEGRGPKVKRRR